MANPHVSGIPTAPPRPPAVRRVSCRCGAVIEAVPTAYGHRAICSTCNVRWTNIRGVDSTYGWVEERR